MTGEAAAEPELDTILDAFTDACRRGEEPTVDSWAERFPRHGDNLRALLPALLLLESNRTVRTDAAAERKPKSMPMPDRLGEYRLVREIGRGGMGVVFEAVEEPLNRRVALKLLPAIQLASGADLSRFRLEAELASRLDHPGICTVYRAGVEAGIPYIAMRFVEGETLSRLLTRARAAKRPPSRDQIRDLLGIVERVARALHLAHEAGLIHRDIKPQNIMIDPRGEPVILDFGLARDIDQATVPNTRPGQLCGTPAYLAPETLQAGPAKPDRSADIYALGVTLFECVTLQRPFESPTLEALYRSIIQDSPPDPRSLNPAVDADTSAVIATALEKEPARRYRSTTSFADDIRALIEGRPVSAKRPSIAGRLGRWARRQPAKAALFASVLILVPALAATAGFVAANLPRIRAAEETQRREEIEAALETGFIELGEGSRDAAVVTFQQVLARDPDCVEAVAGAAVALLYQLDVQATLAMLDAHRDLESRHPSLRHIRSDALRRQRRDDEAAELVRGLAEPATAVDCFVNGIRELDIGHDGDRKGFSRARDLFERALSLCRVQRHFYVGALAHAAWHCKDRKTVEAATTTLTSIWGDSAGSWYWTGVTLEDFDSDASEAAYRRALALRPDFGVASEGLGGLLVDRGKHAEGLALLRHALELQPRSMMTLSHLGKALHSAGNLEESVAVLRRSIEIHPKLARTRRLLGAALCSSGDLDGSLAEYEKATELDPGHAENWGGLGFILQTRGQFDEAERAYARAVQCDASSAWVHRGLGAARLRAGNAEGAAVALREAARLDPTDPHTFNNLFIAEITRGARAGALDALRRGFGVNPKDDIIHHNLVDMLSREGRYAELLAVARRRAEALPEDARARDAFGNARYDLNDYEGAVRELKRAIAIDPGLAEAWCHLGSSLTELGKLDEATSAMRRGHEIGSASEKWSLPSERCLRELAALSHAAALLPQTVAGDDPPEDGSTRVRLAWLAGVSGEHELALRLYRDLEAEMPPNLREERRTVAFRRAIVEVSKSWIAAESRPSPAPEATALRDSARAFFARELATDVDDRGERPLDPNVRRRWDRWLHDPRLARVRDESFIGMLPANEQAAWRDLWRRATELGSN